MTPQPAYSQTATVDGDVHDGCGSVSTRLLAQMSSGPAFGRDFAVKLLDARLADALAENLGKFHELDRDVAHRLLNWARGGAARVAGHIDRFRESDRLAIAFWLCGIGSGDLVLKNLDAFRPLDLKQLFIWLCADGHGDAVWTLVKEHRHLKKHQAFTAADVLALLDGGAASFIGGMEEFCPGFSARARRSRQALLDLLSFRGDWTGVLENADAHRSVMSEANPQSRFLHKLVLAHRRFDAVAKGKIGFIFRAMSEQRSLAPRDVAFRLAMQERLADYGRNGEITETIRASGIDLHGWLSYAETSRFILRQPDSVPSEPHVAALSALAGDLVGAVVHYVQIVRSALRERRSDLMARCVATPVMREALRAISEIEISIRNAAASGIQEWKVRWMREGLRAQRKKRADHKPEPLWSSLTNQIGGIMQLSGTLGAALENAARSEEEFRRLLLGPTRSASDVLTAKESFAKARRAFVEIICKLESRLCAFQEAAAAIRLADGVLQDAFLRCTSGAAAITPVLGAEWGGPLDRLLGHPMRIDVWSRNPDVDLYLGNYTSCCTSIEGEIFGSGCPIADYITDLGVQMVVISDECNDEPVAVAWCWVGADECGEPAIVVDNIEADTAYSVLHAGELWAALRGYLERYAIAADASRLVLGLTNNDLPAAAALQSMPDAKRTYRKLGGVNVRHAYYLESERRDVKEVWRRPG